MIYLQTLEAPVIHQPEVPMTPTLNSVNSVLARKDTTQLEASAARKVPYSITLFEFLSGNTT